MNDKQEADIAISLIGIILQGENDEGVMALAGDLAATMRDVRGENFIDWEGISAACDQREWALSQGRDDNTIDPSDFSSVIAKIQARCGINATERINYLLN